MLQRSVPPSVAHLGTDRVKLAVYEGPVDEDVPMVDFVRGAILDFFRKDQVFQRAFFCAHGDHVVAVQPDLELFDDLQAVRDAVRGIIQELEPDLVLFATPVFPRPGPSVEDRQPSDLRLMLFEESRYSWDVQFYAREGGSLALDEHPSKDLRNLPFTGLLYDEVQGRLLD